MPKKTIEDYKNICKNRILVWDDIEIPKNVHTKTYWKCLKCGYRWKATYDKIRQGRGCPRCAHHIRKTKQDYYKLVKNRDIEWIGDIFPRTTRIKTLWKCLKCGNEWETSYGEIRNLKGCPVCAGNLPKTESDYIAAAESIGYKWIGGELPKNTKTKTFWRCNKGHRFKMSYGTLVINGNRCPICGNRVPKVKKDYEELAEKHNFIFDGKCLPKTTHYKTWWICKKAGHRFGASYNNIGGGWGCPYCSGVARKTEKDYHDLAESRNFKWIGKVLPKNNREITQWQCEKGHIWETCYNIIQRGRTCPYCKNFINGSRVSKPQRKLNSILYGSLNYPESNYRIDVAIMRKSQKIAVEYDCWCWHNGREEQDAKRDKFLISKGWKILHVKAGVLIPTRKQLDNKINKLLFEKKNIVSLYLRDWKFKKLIKNSPNN